MAASDGSEIIALSDSWTIYQEAFSFTTTCSESFTTSDAWSFFSETPFE
jgi:hypothetical protein